jgi:ureidoacrylate peracid hydrolase
MTTGSDALFSPELVARVVARRGQLHLTRALDPRRTALVVIDMQRAFTEADAPSGTPSAKAIVPNINRLAAALRAGGGHVAFSQGTFSDAPDGGWPAFYTRMVGPEAAHRILAALRPGHALHALDPGLTVAATDLVFAKNRYSAFAPNASVLPAWLAARDVRTVVVVGTLTNICCESTARDAMQWGFDAIMVADANAARSAAAHQATLDTFVEFFGDVLTTHELLALLPQAQAA